MSQESTSTDDTNIEDQEEVQGDQEQVEGTSTGDSSIPRFEFSVDKGQAAKELLRLRAEHPEFYQTISAQIGQKSANRFRRELREKDEQLTETRKLLRWNEISRMEPTEVQKQFDSNPDFAKEYAELAHFQPQTQPSRQTQVVDEQAQINEVLQDLWGEARAAGVSEETLQETAQAMMNGRYGVEGEDHWTAIVNKMSLDLGRKMAQASTPTQQPKQQTQPETPLQTNANLLRGSGDVTRTGGGSAVGNSFPKTLDEFKKLPSKQRAKLIESDTGEAELDKLLAAAQRNK